MNIQIFGSSKSFDSKKAERWFKERRITYVLAADVYAAPGHLGRGGWSLQGRWAQIDKCGSRIPHPALNSFYGSARAYRLRQDWR